MAGSEKDGEEPRLTRYVSLAERAVYYVAAVFLLGAIALLFLSTGRAFLEVGRGSLTDVALTVLDRVLLIFILVELLNTVGVIIREREIVAEPFILIGLIAAVRRILSLTADIEQSLGDPTEFRNLVLELGVLTVLVITLTGAFYLVRRLSERTSDRNLEDSPSD